MKTMTRAIGASAVALLLLGLVPAADAQTIPACANGVASSYLSLETKSFSAGEANIKPITGFSTAKFTFRYTTDAQARSISQVPITITHGATVPWLTTSVGSSSLFIPVEPSSQGGVDETFDVEVDVTATDQAPAFAKGNIEVTVEAGQGTCISPSEQAAGEFQMVAGFYENYQASFQTAIWKTGQNERIQIPLIVSNFGNGHIKVQMAPGEGTSGKLNFALPGIQTVESQIAGGDTTEVQIPIDIQTPFKNGYENRRDQFNLQVSGYYFADPAEGLTSVDLQAVIQTQGVYVPGFELVGMLGAALGAALIMRRRV